jgi:hypothetical protein
MIDNLNGKNVLITDLLKNKNIELFNNELLFNYDEVFKTKIYKIFILIIYEFKNKIVNENKEELSKFEYINKIIKLFLDENNKDIYNCIKDKFYNFIETNNDSFLKTFLIKNDGIDKNETDFISIVKKNQNLLFFEFVSKIIIKSEIDGVLNPLIFNPNESNQLFYLDYLKNNDFYKEKYKIIEKNNLIQPILGLYYSTSILFFKLLKSKLIKYVNEYSNNEDEIRETDLDEEDEKDKIEELKKNYENNKEKVLNTLSIEIENNDYFKKLNSIINKKNVNENNNNNNNE